MKNANYLPPLLVFSPDYPVKKRLAARELSNDYRGKVENNLPIAFEKTGRLGRGDRVEIRTVVANKRIGGKNLEDCPAVDFIEVIRNPFESYTKFVRRVFDTVLKNGLGQVKFQYDTPSFNPLQFSND